MDAFRLNPKFSLPGGQPPDRISLGLVDITLCERILFR